MTLVRTKPRSGKSNMHRRRYLDAAIIGLQAGVHNTELLHTPQARSSLGYMPRANLRTSESAPQHTQRAIASTP